MRMIRKIGNIIAALFKGLWMVLDIRDFFVFGGVGMLGYGIYLLKGLGWALVACGPLLIVIGYLMRDKEEGAK